MGLTRIVSGSRGRDTPGQALLCPSRDRLARDTPLSAFVTEVVCTVGGAAPRRDLTDSKRGELRCTRTPA